MLQVGSSISNFCRCSMYVSHMKYSYIIYVQFICEFVQPLETHLWEGKNSWMATVANNNTPKCGTLVLCINMSTNLTQQSTSTLIYIYFILRMNYENALMNVSFQLMQFGGKIAKLEKDHNIILQAIPQQKILLVNKRRGIQSDLHQLWLDHFSLIIKKNELQDIYNR